MEAVVGIGGFIVDLVQGLSNFTENLVSWISSLYDFTQTCKHVFSNFYSVVAPVFTYTVFSGVGSILLIIFSTLCVLKIAKR